MVEETLVNRRIEAGEKFLKAFHPKCPVSVAFWIKPEENPMTYLYVASDEVADGNLGEVFTLARSYLERSVWLNSSHLRFLKSSDPMAQSVREYRDQYDPEEPIPIFHRGSIGMVPIEDAIVYPSMEKLLAAPSE